LAKRLVPMIQPRHIASNFMALRAKPG